MSSNDSELQYIENDAASAAIRRATLLLAITSGFASIAIFLFHNGSPHYTTTVLYPSLMLTAIGCITVGLSYWINASRLAFLLIVSVQAVAFATMISYGSIRAGASVMMLATVVAAGVFMSKRTLVLTWLSGLSLLGVATYAEVVGLITPVSHRVSGINWLVHAAVLSAVALLVFYSRERTRSAYERQFQALRENKLLADERDRNLEHFTRIFRTSPSPMVAQTSNTGKIVDVNPAFERAYGYTKAEVLGHSDRRMWADPAQRHQHLLNLQTTKHAETSEAIAQRADGSHFPVHIRSEWGNEDEGSLVITTVTDMTEHHAILDRLRRSEERFSKAFHLSPLNLMITRQSDDTVVEINSTRGAGSNLATPGASALSASQAGPWFTQADRASFIDQLATQGHLHGFETSMVRPDGSMIDAKIWAEYIEIDAEPCILSCVIDATEEKRRETLLRDIAKGMTGHTSQAFFQALTQQMSQALGADMVLIGEFTEAHNITTLAVSRDGEESANFTFSIAGRRCEENMGKREPLLFQTHAMGDEKWCGLDESGNYGSILCQALHDMEGNPIGLLKALWRQSVSPSADLMALMSLFASRSDAELMRMRSERKIEHLNETLEQRVQARTGELLKLNAELDSFAYSISHDLKSPLRAIDGFTQLLSERLQGRAEPEDQQLMERVLGATHRMATLMADLLALTRISQQPLDIERINLSMMAKEELEACLVKTPRPGLKWHIALGLVAHADRQLLRMALKNLLENAIKYTRDQPLPLIEIGRAVPHSSETSDRAIPIFFIRDNGVGFSMAHADKLFKPFQRLHMPSAGFDGTGIGLATVRRIVERHGGTIEAKASIGAGAEFKFSLGADTTP